VTQAKSRPSSTRRKADSIDHQARTRDITIDEVAEVVAAATMIDTVEIATEEAVEVVVEA
jgi:hypothetical protein